MGDEASRLVTSESVFACILMLAVFDLNLRWRL